MSASKRPAAAVSLRVLALGILVIALTATVIASQVAASATLGQRQQQLEASQKLASPAESMAPRVLEVVVAAAPASPADSPQQAATEPRAAQAMSPLEPIKESPASVSSSSDAKASEPAARSEASPADSKAAAATESAEAASRRKGRSGSAPTAAQAAASEPAPAAPVSAEASRPSEKAPAEEESAAAAPPAAAAEKASATEKPAAPKSAPTPAIASPKPAKGQLSGKSGQKSKLPANLGTVTSTGSGGPAHYMSKHDAYSAIAEKHGALAQDAMHNRKTDKRSGHLHSIQKASGFSDALGSPFKGVSDSGLARTLGASMRSIMKSKYSVPAYVASALLGAVALMAFYESPISPLPVPPLPEPPIGRFPPEMPNIPPNTQVPFRGANQQQQFNFNQRSSAGGVQVGPMTMTQASQQVLFPGASTNQAQALQAQQRQSGGAVQQLAANLLGSVAKPQVAQRKSGPDYDYSASSRSFLGSQPANRKMSSSGLTISGQQKQQQAGNSFLSYFGFGGSSSEPAGTTGGQQQHLAASNLNLVQSAMGPIAASFGSQGIEPKGQSGSNGVASGIANSNLINRVRSFFSRSPASPSSSSSGSSASSSSSANPQQRPSFLQTLVSLDSSYLLPLRKSFPSSSLSSSLGANKLQQSFSQISGSSSGAQGTQPPASRIGGASNEPVGQASGAQMLAVAGKQQQGQQQKPTGSISHGFMNRIAHALLETFTSGGVAQRNAVSSSASQHGGADRKSSVPGDDSHHQQSPLASATSLLTDIMTSYGANVMAGAVSGDQQASGQQHEQAKAPVQQQQQTASKSSSNNNGGQPEEASGRSDEAPRIITAEDVNVHFQPQKQQQQMNAMISNKQQVSASSGPVSASSGQQQSSASDAQVAPTNPAAATGAALTRKTRSIGLEYPVDSNQELMHKQGQQQLHPSRAAQINNVIDFVADSYSQNRLLFNFVMNQVGLSQAVPYVEQILASGNNEYH